MSDKELISAIIKLILDEGGDVVWLRSAFSRLLEELQYAEKSYDPDFPDAPF